MIEFLLIAGALWLFIMSIFRIAFDGGWKYYWRHPCGYYRPGSEYTGCNADGADPCKGCGEADKKWKRAVGRLRWPYGIEWKDKDFKELNG
jgi:hypothetical protein